MKIDWVDLALVIPLIVLMVTLIFNLFKERRDRNYQYRPIATFYTITNTGMKTDNQYIMYNDEVLEIDIQDEGVFLSIKNISDPPMLNVLVDVYYGKGRPVQSYQIYLIEKQNTFILPISEVKIQNGNYVITEQFSEIQITYRSISGQRYNAKIKKDGKIDVSAKRLFIGKETIFSIKSGRNSEFRGL